MTDSAAVRPEEVETTPGSSPPEPTAIRVTTPNGDGIENVPSLEHGRIRSPRVRLIPRTSTARLTATRALELTNMTNDMVAMLAGDFLRRTSEAPLAKSL